MALNVNRNIQDNFYRYKMPRLVAKVEGKGNGVKTVIPNMVDIARALARPPTYCTKYFGCELGAQTQFDFKNDRYIVNGSHEAGKLQDMLDGFIKKFVLCEKCENPETVFKILTKKGIINSSCKACGHVFMLDMRHKLTTFILKNPPEQNIDAHGTSLTKRKDKKSQRKEQQDENENNGNDDSVINEDDDWDDGEWSADVSEEAVKQRMKELSEGVKGLAMDDDMEKTETERVNIFHNFVKDKMAENGGAVDKVDKEIFGEAERLEIVNKAPIVLCELLFTDSMVAEVKKNKRLLLRFTNENQKAQKYLLGGVEKTIETRKAVLLPKTASIFKTLYDLDILDEEVLIEWSKKVSKKYVSKELAEQIHKKAEPFITWLKEAEEESSEDELELEFDDRARITEIKAMDKKNGDDNKKEEEKKIEEQNGEEEHEDLDIDDI